MYRDSVLHLPEEYEPIIRETFRVLNPAWTYASRHGYEGRMETFAKHLLFYWKHLGVLHVPRAYEDASIPMDLVEDKTLWNNPVDMAFRGKLFPKQEEAFDLVAKRNGNVILEMPTGSGKTVVGMALATHFKRRTLVLTHKQYLLKQWDTQFREFTNVKPQILRAERMKFVNIPQVMLAMAQTIRSRKRMLYESGFFNQFDVVIIDECHRFSAITFYDAISSFPGRIRIGLTATAFRNDGLDVVFRNVIGPVISVDAKIEQYPTIVVRHTGYKKAGNNKASYSILITQMSKSKRRNNLILNDVFTCVDNGRTVLVLSDRLNQVRNFKTTLEKQYPDKKIALLTGSDPNEVDPKTADVIVATNGVAKEGMDVPKLDTLVYATPISDRISVIQSIGRLLRGKNEKELLIFDYVDDNPMSKALYAKRLPFYKAIGIEKIIHKKGA